jgi:hypothetical protein
MFLHEIADMTENSADRRSEAMEDTERPLLCHRLEEPFADIDRVASDDRA